MKIKVGNNIHDANVEPIMIIFKDNNELKSVISQLDNMLPYSENNNIRKFVIYPDNTDINYVKEFMKI